jgi:L-aminopeptidase/D-esterase-like protein
MITRVEGIRVGHTTDLQGLTGCTVVLCPDGTVGSGSVRGGAPGTRETDLLRPGSLVQEVHAVLLAGGSAFGLAAADGVMRWLEERGVGFDAGAARVPIVPAAILFDLGVGDPARRPGPDDGYAACEAASAQPAEGSVGAGTGATVAKLEGPERAVKGGVGTVSLQQEGVTVGALAVVNALGEIVEEDGAVIAGPVPEPRAAEGAEPRAADPEPRAADPADPAHPADAADAADPTLFEVPPVVDPPGGRPADPGMNTTLVVVATDARLSKERAHLLSLAGHEGLTRAIRPVHTIWDGDTVFALATGRVEAAQALVERLASDAVAEAIRRAVRLAEPLGGIPAAGDLGEAGA